MREIIPVVCSFGGGGARVARRGRPAISFSPDGADTSRPVGVLARLKRPLTGLLFVFPTCIGMVPDLHAAPRTPEEVELAVQAWVRRVTADAQTDATIERLEPILEDGSIVAFVAHLDPQGFCLCGVDDLVLPVYFYSPRGTYTPDIPDYGLILREIVDRTRALREGERTRNALYREYELFLARRQNFWESLVRSGPLPGARTDPNRLELPLSSQWAQGWPYNHLCPLGSGETWTLTGCVATAATQVMRYWEWPPAGTTAGTIEHSWDGDDSCPQDTTEGELLAVTIADTYDWDNMPNWIAWNSSDEERAAVAELCYEVGVALHMDYGVCSSGTPTDRIPSALPLHFDYDSDAAIVARDIEQMTEELDWLRPVVLRGHSSETSGGHAWVVFGYDKGTDPDRQFRMNMGWSGGSDGWYTCDSIPYGYNESQEQVIRLAPEEVVAFVDTAGDGDGSPSDPYGGIEEAVLEAVEGATLVFRARSWNSFPGPASLVIDRPMKLTGVDVKIGRE